MQLRNALERPRGHRVNGCAMQPPSVRPACRWQQPRCLRRVSCNAAEAADGASASSSGSTPAADALAAAQGDSAKKPSANAICCDALANISITIVGSDTELNWEVCKVLSKRIGWFPSSSAKVLQGLHKVNNVAELEKKLGKEGLAAAEAEVLKGLSRQFRVCVATLGNGASTLPTTYPSLYGSFIVWLHEVDPRRPQAPTPAQQLWHRESEVRGIVEVSRGFSSKPATPEEKAKQAAGQLVKGLTQLVKKHDYLPSKKRLYVEYGCRGDWPELKPKEWSPVLDLLDRKPVQAAEPEAAAAAAGGGVEAAA